MKVGRPQGSLTRDRLIDMLFVMGSATSYDLHKHYVVLFGKITQRNIYYHMRKGEASGIFEVDNIVDEKGDYSWGGVASKVYYKLGKMANPKINPDVKKYFDKLN